MKKKYVSLFLALTLLLSLAACGAAGGNSMIAADSAQSESNTAPGAASGEAGWDGGYDLEFPLVDGMEDPPQSAGTLPANAKMIYTADLSLESQDFDAAAQAVDRLAEELGGWFESRRVEQGSGRRYLYCTVRVPAEHFAAFLDRAGEAAHLLSREENGQDVSEAYYDNEARLTTQRTKLERLQTLLAQAESMEDIISLESAISDTELEIEYLTGALRRYDSLVGYSTITLSLREVYRLSDDQEVPVTFGQRLSAALAAGLRSGVSGAEDVLIALARNWLTLLVWIVIIAVAAVLVRRYLRRRKAAHQPPPAQKPSEPPETKK